ncbi:PRD domain-containing protein [Enterococcus hulanensis]|uniref:PRD domain-containing protein n=1 Tax=Enterococcus hulanensis TaxID=2559929 RepID=A0ABU3EUI6_9ENTE|nr:PRD domain-containing protein [Enterococcus hulanensis]MDT2598539.1 PRD domain-containing protein [Enterococcus hulanensis]MDT2607956.1 PRD domain-containing protein [Enterococcus hulanensis]MDT2615251.1 PRD domain-containing protein [Enterococcus hulanensis]MDT2626778.1 PRD domain-containing protein [Enterococcus hulanensis]MDT2654323.1 PRD domain-containing protein [Enterococcus hulanensis]
MIFSSNENMMINILNFDEYVSAKYLAETLYVSTKTVYRMIKKINELFIEEKKVPLIISEHGKGYRLSSRFRNSDVHSMVEFAEENTLNEVALALLFKYPNKVKRTVMNTDYLSDSSIERRLKKIAEIINKYAIQLHYDREYLWLSGKEVTIRKAINHLFLEMNKLNSLSEIGITINAIDKYFIDQQIVLIEEMLNEYINYPYDITIYTHIYMVMKRYREGEVHYLGNQEPLEKEERLLMESNPQLLEVATKIIRNIENYLSIQMDSLEIYFVFQNIYSINSQKRESSNVDKKLAEEITKKFITDYFMISDVTLLPESRSLYEDLYQHILPMLSRLRSGIRVENNLLDELLLEYRSTFLKVKTLAEEINQELMFDTKMNDAEIGYLTLYFEKYKIHRQEDKNILLICSTGVGTSELLKVRIQQNFPTMNIIATMSQRQVKKNLDFIKENVDLIFSTIRVPMEIENIPILLISPLLIDKDIQNINHTMKEIEQWKK